jgi:hypothetical protein
MSHYLIPARKSKDEVRVGWDPMQNTYFAHVIDMTKDEDDEDRDVLWIGTTFNEVHSLEILEATLLEFAVMSEDMKHQLYGDANG